MASNNAVNTTLSGQSGTGAFAGNLNPALTTPRVINGLYDSNANAMFSFNPVISAVNNLNIINSIAGQPPQLTAVGSDTNIGMYLASKGSYQITLFGALGGTNPLLLVNGTGYQHVTAFNFANTPAVRTVTFQDSDGTLAYLADRDWVRIGTANASNSSAITFTGLTGYINYMLVWDSLFAGTNGATLAFQGSINNGSSWLSSAPAYYQQSCFYTGATVSAGSDITTLTSAVLSSSLSNIGTNVCGGSLVLANLALTTGSRPTAVGMTQYVNTTPTIAGMNYWFQIRDPGSPVNAIRIFMSSGVIVSGTVQLYGMK
jgi:hypothetical protein